MARDEGAATGVGRGGGDGPLRGPLRRWGVRALQIGLTVAVTWFIVDRVGVTVEDVAGLDRRWLRPAWGLLAGASAVLLASFGISAVLWGRMVRELGGPSLGPVDAARIHFTANLGRYVPGKVWQIASLAYLARRAGVGASLAAVAAILVQAVSLGGAAVVGTGALVGPTRPLGGWGGWLAGGAVALLALGLLPPVFRWGMDLWFRLSGRSLPEDFEPDPTFGVRWIGLFAANWVLQAGAFWLMARSFGVEGSALVLAPAFAAAYVLGYLMIFAPAGLGVREGFLIAFLEPTIGAAAATATAVLARLWMTIVELVPALAFAVRTAGRSPDGEGRRDR